MNNRKEGRFQWEGPIEAAIMTGAIVAISMLAGAHDRGFVSIHPHPFWIPVILVSLRHGFKESMLGAIIACAAYVYFTVGNAGVNYHFSSLRIFDDFREPVCFIAAAWIISGVSESASQKLRHLKEMMAAKEGRIQSLSAEADAAKAALTQLEKGIAGQFNTIRNLFDSLSVIKKKQTEEIKKGLLDALAEYIGAKSCSFYEMDNDHLVKTHAMGHGDESPSPGGEDAILEEAILKKEVAHIGRHAGNSAACGGSIIAGPILDRDGNVGAIVSIEKMPFVSFTPDNIRLFGVLLHWWSSILDENRMNAELREKSVFDEEMQMYSYSYFLRRYEQEFERSKLYSIPLSLCIVRINNFADVIPEKARALRKAIAGITSRFFTEIDIISAFREDSMMAATLPIKPLAEAEAEIKKAVSEIESFGFQPYENPKLKLSISWAAAEFEMGMKSGGELLAKVEKRLTPAKGG